MFIMCNSLPPNMFKYIYMNNYSLKIHLIQILIIKYYINTYTLFNYCVLGIVLKFHIKSLIFTWHHNPVI